MIVACTSSDSPLPKRWMLLASFPYLEGILHIRLFQIWSMNSLRFFLEDFYPASLTPGISHLLIRPEETCLAVACAPPHHPPLTESASFHQTSTSLKLPPHLGLLVCQCLPCFTTPSLSFGLAAVPRPVSPVNICCRHDPADRTGAAWRI